MFSKYLKFTISVFVLAIFSLCFGASAKAAETTSSVAGLIVSPPLVEKEATPGNAYDGKVKITNPNSDTDLNVEISVNDFKANGEGGEQTFVDPAENSTFSLGTWITIDKNVVLTANETKEIPYTVNVPANAEPGGHYGVIFFVPSVKKSASVTGNGVMAIPKIGSLLLFKIPGDIKYDANIQEFSINKKLFGDSKSSVDFVTRFQNLSSTHVKPQGNIVVRNTFGKEVTNLVVNEKMGNVLPDSIRRFDNNWEKKYGFGLYKATVTLAYGDTGATTAEISFWIIPWKETAGVIIIIALVIWILSHLKWGGNNKNNSSGTPVASNQPTYQAPAPPVAPVQNTAPIADNPVQSVPPQVETPTQNDQISQSTQYAAPTSPASNQPQNQDSVDGQPNQNI